MDLILFLISVGVLVLYIALIIAVFDMRSYLREIAREAKAINLYLRDIRDSVYTEADNLRAKQ